MIYHWLSAAALALMLLVATVWDIRRQEIPGLLTIGGLAGGVLVNAAGLGDIASSLLGAAAGAGLLIVFVWLGGMGIGDAWLMAAIGAWSNGHFVLMAALWASLAGGAMAVIVAVACRNGQSWRKRAYPYVPAIAAGTAIAFFIQ
jgi:prepilin peptidase CpaA